MLWSKENPVQNEWYTIFEETNVRLVNFALAVQTTAETVEFRATVDGVVYALSQTANIGVAYYIHNVQTAISANHFGLSNVNYGQYRPFHSEAHSIKLEMRKTTANGNGTFNASVTYAKFQ
jgi:hypothetical protein